MTQNMSYFVCLLGPSTAEVPAEPVSAPQAVEEEVGEEKDPREQRLRKTQRNILNTHKMKLRKRSKLRYTKFEGLVNWNDFTDGQLKEMYIPKKWAKVRKSSYKKWK